MTEKKLIDKIFDPDIYFVSAAEAATFLGLAKCTAYASYHSTGLLVDGVPIYKTGQRRYLVATAHLRELLKPVKPLIQQRTTK